jgi:hypothetical protein
MATTRAGKGRTGMTSMLGKGKTRIVVALLAVFVIAGAVVYASTDVEVTKTGTIYASTYFYDGSNYVSVYVRDLNDKCYLSYYVRDYDTNTIVERGWGYISCDDVSFAANKVTLDTDTSDIAVTGDGGTLTLVWTPEGGTTYSSDYKRKTTTATTQVISFSGYEQSSALVEGSVFGDDYASTGWIQVNKGKTITQFFGN